MGSEPRGGATARAGLLVLGLALLAACSGRSRLEEPLGAPYVRGAVETVTHHATGSGLLVRAGPGSREPCGIAARMDAATRVLQRSPSGVLRRIAASEIAVGDTVEIYVDGPVAESCPVQGHAAAVVEVLS